MDIRFTHCRALAVAGLSIAALITSCGGTGDANQPGPQGATPSQGRAAAIAEPVTVASGLEAPWSVVFPDGATLVSERDSARILEVLDDGSTRVIGTVEGVAAAGEGGLLGLAVDDEQRLYVYSTAADGNRIQRFTLAGDPGGLELGQAETLLDGIPAANYHDGGRLAFGPDGMLYATTGDAGQRDTAQDRTSLAGKILRMTPDGDAPDDNPFPGSLTYSYGHRNPQGLAWSDDGTMFATEFGQNTWDELNIITPGANYGWPVVEGIAGTDGFADPVQQWDPKAASPSGMAHRDGTLYIANLRGQVLRTVPAADPGRSVDYFTGDYGRLRDVAVGPDGDVWILTSNTDGRGEPSEADDQLLRLPVQAP
ncbi:sorbosone dehydrogenase family protein [Arthrobacter sp. SX1312]|uniref:PQQ-dependent sugar dehydrogenase n=1 Tax=Arthrobacter sp. SX1312 TaxID=2058896 RepID=UPI000CE4B9EE|nr:PQQ-dependent sugar dehydrogenase [Arthrobacter sp. SX1312]